MPSNLAARTASRGARWWSTHSFRFEVVQQWGMDTCPVYDRFWGLERGKLTIESDDYSKGHRVTGGQYTLGSELQMQGGRTARARRDHPTHGTAGR